MSTALGKLEAIAVRLNINPIYVKSGILALQASPLMKAAKAKCKNGTACFVAGTGVLSGVDVNGYTYTKIEDLKVGDLVLARDQHDAGDDLDYRRVVNVFRRTSNHVRSLTILDAGGNIEIIQTTDEHPFWVEGLGWTSAGAIGVGNRVGEADGSNDAVVIASERIEHPSGITVYNFEVEGDHTYFVEDGTGDADAVWVHNAGEVCGISTHVSKKMMGRGWMQKDITDTVSAPFRTATVDRNGQPFKNLATGHSATAYIRADEHGVLRDDGTGEVFHVSNINDPDWQLYWSWPQ